MIKTYGSAWECNERPMICTTVMREDDVRNMFIYLMREITGSQFYEDGSPWHNAWMYIASKTMTGIIPSSRNE